MKTYNFKRWEKGKAPRSVRSYPKTMPKYGYDVDKETGEKIVVKQGETNVFLQTQEARADTLIYNIIDKINRTGDMSLLGNSVEGFIDVTSMPKTFLEAQVMRVKAEQFFDRLPIEEKAKFQNNVSVFIKSVNEGFNARVPDVGKMRDEVKKEENNNETK